MGFTCEHRMDSPVSKVESRLRQHQDQAGQMTIVAVSWVNRLTHEYRLITGVVKCPILGILDITL